MEKAKGMPGPDRQPFKNINKRKDYERLNDISGSFSSFVGRELDIKTAARALGMSPDNQAEVAKSAKKVFEDLKDIYGIPVAVRVVPAERYEGGPLVIHTLTDKIQGVPVSMSPGSVEDLIDKKEFPEADKERFISELDQLFSSLALYIADRWKRHDFLWDIFSTRQYMWGRVAVEGKEEEKSHIYLVDVDLHTNASYNTPGYYAGDYERLIGEILIFERKLGTTFSQARETLKQTPLLSEEQKKSLKFI